MHENEASPTVGQLELRLHLPFRHDHNTHRPIHTPLPLIPLVLLLLNLLLYLLYLLLKLCTLLNKLPRSLHIRVQKAFCLLRTDILTFQRLSVTFKKRLSGRDGVPLIH